MCIIIKSISTIMCMVWHADKYKIIFYISYQFQEALSWPGMIEARAQWLRNTNLEQQFPGLLMKMAPTL